MLPSTLMYTDRACALEATPLPDAPSGAHNATYVMPPYGCASFRTIDGLTPAVVAAVGAPPAVDSFSSASPGQSDVPPLTPGVKDALMMDARRPHALAGAPLHEHVASGTTGGSTTRRARRDM